jgi:hypothetical protein
VSRLIHLIRLGAHNKEYEKSVHQLVQLVQWVILSLVLPYQHVCVGTLSLLYIRERGTEHLLWLDLCHSHRCAQILSDLSVLPIITSF